MANQPGQPYPFPQPIRQDYDNDSDILSPYTSTTRLAGNNNNPYDNTHYNGE